MGDLAQPRIALHHHHLQPGPFGHRGIVAELHLRHAGGAPVRLHDGGETEGLRRLRGAQQRARRRGGDDAMFVHLLDGVHHLQAGNGAVMLLQRRQQPVDDIRRQEGPRGIVDQHHLRRAALLLRKRHQAVEHALLARRSAHDGRAHRQPPRGVGEIILLSGADDHPHRANRRMRQQRQQGMAQQRLPGHLNVLLRPVLPGAAARAGGNDECGNLRHGWRAPG